VPSCIITAMQLPSQPALDQPQLMPHDVKTLRHWALGAAYMASVTPIRLSSTQLAIFSYAALAHYRGSPTTFSELRDAFGGAVHCTYKVFLERKRDRGVSLGWLKQVPHPQDIRQKLLYLTPTVRRVVQRLLEVLGPCL
jgi:hypothetical protein